MHIKKYIFLIFILITFMGYGQIKDTTEVKNEKSTLFDGEERVWLENNEVSIVPPNQFERSYKFYGFLHRNTATTISIVKIPDYARSLYEKGLTQEHFDKYRLTLLSKEKVELDSLKGTLYKFDFIASNTEMRRLTLLTGDYNNSYLIIGNFPAMVIEDMEEVIKECLLSTIIYK